MALIQTSMSVFTIKGLGDDPVRAIGAPARNLLTLRRGALSHQG
jgi:hypothetical protein